MSICKQCQSAFEVTDEDRKLLQKIAPRFNNIRYDFPEPTLCPDCRHQRRIAWRNDRKLYHGTCGLTGKKIITLHSPDSPYTSYDVDTWYGDKWDACDYGRDFDFSRPFFEQFQELQLKVPRMCRAVIDNENSPYVNNCWHVRNSHLCFDAGYCEDAHYCFSTYHSRSVFDILRGENLELSYFCTDCANLYECIYTQDCSDCSGAYFSYDCRGCKNILFCSNLRNKEYCVANQQVTPDVFKKYVSQIFTGSHELFAKAVEKFKKVRNAAVHKENRNVNCFDCIGDYLLNCTNCYKCFDSFDSQDCRYIMRADHKVRDIMDVDHLSELELAYECMCSSGYHVLFSFVNVRSNHVIHCDSAIDSKNCIGCVGVQRKQYCILNKQYSFEEYEKLAPKIIEHMIRTKEWGQFFPLELSPYGYNETEACDYYPLEKKDALSRGFHWCDYESPPPEMNKLIQANKLPDGINDIPDDILNWGIVCEDSGKPFKLTSQELEFYRRYHLPIPRKHPEVRYFDRATLRNQPVLYERTCSRCRKQIQSTYGANRKEKVYCENCYLKTVY